MSEQETQADQAETVETETPAEFAGDEQRENHVAALINEKAGYEARGDKDRAAQVQDELDRIAGGAKTGRARASRRG